MSWAVRLHTDAVVGLLEAASLTVGDGTGDALSGGYVVVYPTSPTVQRGAELGTLGEPYKELEIDHTVVCVGSGREQVQSLMDRCLTALQGVTPTVSGRECKPLYLSDSGPLVRDEDDPTGATFSQSVVFTLRSNPA